MARRTLVVLLSAVALCAPVTAATAASPDKPTGELRVCGTGAVTDAYVDRDKIHEEKLGLADGKCTSFGLSKGKYAVTVVGHCGQNQDASLTGVAVAPASRALYQDGSLAGARVVVDSTTTWTATWQCVGAVAPEATPTPFNP